MALLLFLMLCFQLFLLFFGSSLMSCGVLKLCGNGVFLFFHVCLWMFLFVELGIWINPFDFMGQFKYI